MALIQIGDSVITGDNSETPLVFNLESNPLGDYFYMHGTDGKLYLSYTNNKFHLVRADQLIINKVLASPTPIHNKIQIFRDQKVTVQVGDQVYPKYFYLDVIEAKSYAWLWILVAVTVILLFLIICLIIKFTTTHPSDVQNSEKSTFQRSEGS